MSPEPAGEKAGGGHREKGESTVLREVVESPERHCNAFGRCATSRALWRRSTCFCPTAPKPRLATSSRQPAAATALRFTAVTWLKRDSLAPRFGPATIIGAPLVCVRMPCGSFGPRVHVDPCCLLQTFGASSRALATQAEVAFPMSEKVSTADLSAAKSRLESEKTYKLWRPLYVFKTGWEPCFARAETAQRSAAGLNVCWCKRVIHPSLSSVFANESVGPGCPRFLGLGI